MGKNASGCFSLEATLEECRRLGLKLTVAEGGRLVVRGPAGGLPRELGEAIKRHRDVIVALLLADKPGGPSACAAPRPADVANRRPDPEAPQTAPEAPPLDPAVAPYYGDKLPPPLGDAIATVIDRLWSAGCQLRPFPSPTTVAMQCPTCHDGTVELAENDDRSVAVTIRCDCGPTRLLQLLRGLRATVYYKPAPLPRW
jgi:hypothetical protein